MRLSKKDAILCIQSRQCGSLTRNGCENLRVLAKLPKYGGHELMPATKGARALGAMSVNLAELIVDLPRTWVLQ